MEITTVVLLLNFVVVAQTITDLQLSTSDQVCASVVFISNLLLYQMQSVEYQCKSFLQQRPMYKIMNPSQLSELLTVM